LPIPFGNKDSIGNIEYLGQRMRQSSIIRGKPQRLQASDPSSGAPGSAAYLFSWPIDHCIFGNPCWQSRQSRWYWVLGSAYETLPHLFGAMPLHLLAYDRSSGARENPGHSIMTDPTPHICKSHLAIQPVYAILNTRVKIWDTGSLIPGKLQHLMAYHWSWGTPLIRIPESRMLRHGSGICG